jgi:antitoxin component YwqK of YwqJK toxin-antitoxin module
MKQLISILSIIIIFICLACNTQKRIKYWESGSLKSVERVKSHKDFKNYKMNHGRSLFYYENGKKSKLEIYKNDTLVKYRKSWYESGKLCSVDKITGYTYFSKPLSQKEEDGVLISYTLNYTTKHYHQNGSLESEGEIVAGKKENLWIFYDEKGNLLKIEVFKNDSIVK